jgi:hypothetical protein
MLWLAILAVTAQSPSERPIFATEGQTCTVQVLEATEAHLDAVEAIVEASGSEALARWHVLQARRGLVACGIVEAGEERSEEMNA